MLDNETTPASQDTTLLVEQVDSKLNHANGLLKVTEGLQNALAEAKRRYDAGLEVDLSQAIVKSQRQFLEVESQIRKFPGKEVKKVPTPVSGTQLSDDYWAHVAKRKDTIPTGLTTLNTMLGGGLEPQRLVVILGAPGGGKTTLANQIVEYAAKGEKGRPVLYVTSEDSPFTLLSKTLARIGDVDYNAVLKGYPSEKDKINKARSDYRDCGSAELLHYLDATMSIELETIRDAAIAHFEKYKERKQGIIVIDYLQRMARAIPAYRSGNQELRHAVTQLTESLRSMANELDCCVIALAAQNRASGYGAKDNALSSGKESGDIEYTADVIMALGDDPERDAIASFLTPKVLSLVKNRQGGTGQFILDWNGSRQLLRETEVSPPSDEDDNVPVSLRGSRGRR